MHSKKINGLAMMTKRSHGKRENTSLQMVWEELCSGPLTMTIFVERATDDHIQLSKLRKKLCYNKSGKTEKNLLFSGENKLIV